MQRSPRGNASKCLAPLEHKLLHTTNYFTHTRYNCGPRAGNEMDVTLVDLDRLLPPASVMVVTVTATTTSGKPLSEENLQ